MRGMALTSSVVVCTFNGVRYLPSLWESVLAQSQLPDEIVVRDDASTDGTRAMLGELRDRATARGIRVRLLFGETNIGYVANFEAALKVASGDVLFLCDQDDAWHTGKLATQMHEFDCRPELRFLCSDARRVDAAGTSLPRSLFDVLKVGSSEFRRIHASRGFEVLLRRSLATGATVALRRSLAIEAMPFAPGWVHDEWLAIMAAARDGFDCLEEALIDYRQHDANQIGMPDRNLRQKWNDLVGPRAAKIDTLVRRSEVLLQRLGDMPGVKPYYVEMALQKLEHLRVRQMFRGPPWRRARGVVRESLGGRYRLYSSGWRSALRDLLRQA